MTIGSAFKKMEYKALVGKTGHQPTQEPPKSERSSPPTMGSGVRPPGGSGGSAAFEAIKPELVAFLKENLSVDIAMSGYGSDYVEATIRLGGEIISSSGALVG